jgi:DNA-binding transcriptional regulator YiaG
MKFELADQDVKLVEGKFVQLPVKRFVELTDYVEDLEARLLAAEINLREAERVGQEMEESAESANAQDKLPEEDVQQVTRVLRQLGPAELRKTMEEQRVSVRRLAMMTGIPYATLYRYVHGQICPTAAAKNIFVTLARMKKGQWQYEGQAAGAAKQRR